MLGSMVSHGSKVKILIPFVHPLQILIHRSICRKYTCLREDSDYRLLNLTKLVQLVKVVHSLKTVNLSVKEWMNI